MYYVHCRQCHEKEGLSSHGQIDTPIFTKKEAQGQLKSRPWAKMVAKLPSWPWESSCIRNILLKYSKGFFYDPSRNVLRGIS